MKFGSIPEGLMENVALRAGKVPIPLIDVLFGPMKARVVMAGVRLGIFDSLSAKSATACELASSLHLNEECVEMLLRVLVHSDYLDCSAGHFSLSRLSRRTLAPGAPMDRRGYVEWSYTQWEILEHLEELVRSGDGIALHETLRDPAAWRFYQRAMLENAREHAAFLAAKVPVAPGARSLIDLGGSHGLLGAAICREHPPMRSTVLEIDPAIEPARELANAEGIGDIVAYQSVDILKDDFGRNHDVALLANILHHFSPEQNQALLSKVALSLKPQATVAIWEFERPLRDAKAGGGDPVALLFRLTSSASAYHADEYAAWLTQAGFRGIRIARPPLLAGYALISARTSIAHAPR